MNLVKWVLSILSLAVVAQTGLSFIRSRAWWIRIFDFPRAQVTFGSLALLVLFGIANLGFEQAGTWEWLLFGLLAAAAVVQVRQMLPYTRWCQVDVPDAQPPFEARHRLRLVSSNVRMDNEEFERWTATVLGEDPDIIVALETNLSWEHHLQRLERGYPYSVRYPLENTYGMIVYSRLPLNRSRVEFLVESTVPSIFTWVELPDGKEVRLVILHPRPPRPDIQQDSDLRDAELVRAARRIRDRDKPVIVLGDLNDVAWSHTTRLFQRIAGVVDPRVGRGRYPTFHAEHRFFRFPLDHVFHSPDFALIQIRRLAYVGSDHFPMLVELVLQEQADNADAEKPDPSDRVQARKAIEEARRLKETESPKERRERRRADR